MPKIAFLGLGLMGTPMAHRLIDAGNQVVVWNRTKERSQQFDGLASAIAVSPAEAAAGADYVITMLANPQALEDTLFGPTGIASALSPGQAWIDMSTVGPDEFRSAAARLPRGVATIDAPVRGSVPQATEGTLAIFVGCHDNLFRPVEALLAPLGHPRHVGPPGAGAAMKLVNNLALGATMVAFGEALALARTLGLHQDAVIEVLSDSPIASIVQAKRANIEQAHYPPAFKLELAAKDLELVHEAANDNGILLPEAEAARWWLDVAVGEGSGGLDLSAVATTIIGRASAPVGVTALEDPPRQRTFTDWPM